MGTTQVGRLKKDAISFFKDNGLAIIIEFRLHKIDSLNVTFDLTNASYVQFPLQRRDGLQKILNRHTVKLSQSCMPNMKRIISGHNSKVIKNDDEPGLMNCQRPDTCPHLLQSNYHHGQPDGQ